MKFSEQWLREWVNPKASTQALEAQLTMAGLEVDGVEPVAGEFTGVVVGQVLETSPHPDADKLTLCSVSVGDAEPLKIVCGAANVRPELKVPVAKVGAVLPGNFKIKAAKLRGQPSAGMLCAEAELGLAESSEGLMELAQDAPVGVDIREYLNLNDVAFDVDLTPNRADCFGLLGIAREVAAINDIEFCAPDISPAVVSCDTEFPVRIEAPEACPRYVGRVIRNVDLSAVSPLWMVEKLRRSGIRSIDPVVDVTNYVMLELGQPLHAFDLAHLNDAIVVRLSSPEEKLTLLDGKELSLDDSTVVIADTKKPLALAGVMGGESAGVSSTTKDIFLESAFFAPMSIAGKARSYGLQTDSSHRFERGVDWQLQVKAAERATQLIVDIVGGEVGPLTEVISEDHLPTEPTITLRASRIKSLLGIDVDAATVENMLKRLGMKVSTEEQGSWQVTAPSHRFDMELEVDLLEEICRLYGYNKVPVVMPDYKYQRTAVSETAIGLRHIRRGLVNRGYQETITYSFVDAKLQAAVDPAIEPLALLNPMSADLAVMRTTIVGGLINAALHNVNRQQTRVRLFETGQVFIPDGSGGIAQLQKIAGLCLGPRSLDSWSGDNANVDFFDIKGDVEALIALTGRREAFSFKAADLPALHPGQSAAILCQDKTVGRIGCLHPSLQRSFGFAMPVYVFELSVAALEEGTLPAYQDISKFPETSRDLAFIVDRETAVADITAEISGNGGELLAGIRLFDVYQGSGIDANCKSVAFALTLQHPSRTLKDEEVNEVVDRVVTAVKTRFNAVLRE